MIKDTESALELMRDYWMQNQPLTYAKHTMQLKAYKMLMEYNDQAPIVESQEQPELPLLKNNDQRKEWLQNYQSWGLWYEDKNIGCRYYKYDFECGAKLIVSEYDNHSPHAYSPVMHIFIWSVVRSHRGANMVRQSGCIMMSIFRHRTILPVWQSF